MRTLLVGDGANGQTYKLIDPDAVKEAEFEYSVAKVLSHVYRGYRCIVFTGTFRFDDRRYRPDLALVAQDYSHWFVIEVELVSHSLEGHVLPQVRAFRYGQPEDDCISILARELELERGQAATLVDLVPRGVAVVANKRDHEWEAHLRALDIQLLSVGVFGAGDGLTAYEIDGDLQVLKESLGFGTYSATDRSVRLPKVARLMPGQVQIDYPTGVPALWTVRMGDDSVWLTKEFGTPDISDGSVVQLVRTVDGRLFLRQP